MTATNEQREAWAYAQAMGAIDLLMGMEPEAAKDSTAGLLLSGLAAATNDYEQMRFPLGNPTPEEAAAFRREQQEPSHDQTDSSQDLAASGV